MDGQLYMVHNKNLFPEIACFVLFCFLDVIREMHSEGYWLVRDWTREWADDNKIMKCQEVNTRPCQRQEKEKKNDKKWQVQTVVVSTVTDASATLTDWT